MAGPRKGLKILDFTTLLPGESCMALNHHGMTGQLPFDFPREWTRMKREV